MHKSSLSPIPTWNILKNYQIKLELCPLAWFLSCFIFCLWSWLPTELPPFWCSKKRCSCLTQDPQKCCFYSWGDTSYKSLGGCWQMRVAHSDSGVQQTPLGWSRDGSRQLAVPSTWGWKRRRSETHTCALNSTWGLPVRWSEHPFISFSNLNVHIESPVCPRGCEFDLNYLYV